LGLGMPGWDEVVKGEKGRGEGDDGGREVQPVGLSSVLESDRGGIEFLQGR
jgi:hypothetical protein